MGLLDNISADYLNEVAGAVDKALAAGLNVILNTHHDSFETDLGNAASKAEDAVKDSTIIVRLWTQVAEHFKSYSDKLIFETFNEVHADGSWLNDSETMVPTMLKACTSTDASYTFQSIWAKAPAAE